MNGDQYDSSDVLGVSIPKVYEGLGAESLWPPLDLVRRRQVYARNLKLMRGEQAEVFAGLRSDGGNAFGESDAAQRWRSAAYICVNLLGRYCDQVGDLMAREAPIIEVGQQPEGTQEQVDRIVSDSRLALTLYKLARSALPCKGDAAMKITIGERGRVRIQSVPPELIAWHHDPFDCERYTAATIGMMMAGGAFLWTEEHGAGYVRNRAFELSVADADCGIYKIGDEVALARAFASCCAGTVVPLPEYETGLDRPTLWKLPNREEDGAFDGASDFTIDAIQIQRSINTLVADTYKHVLEKIGGGLIVGPMTAAGMSRPAIIGVSGGVSDVRAYAGGDWSRRPTIDRDRLKVVFETAEDRNTWRYVSVESAFTGPMLLMERLARLLAFRLGQDLGGLFDSGQGQAVISGRALLFRMAPMLSVVEAKANFLTPVLEQLIYDAQRFEMANRDRELARGVLASDLPDEYEPAVPTVTLRNGLPRDEESDNATVNSRLAAKTLSLRAAIKRLDNTDDAGADAMLNEIAAEDVRFGLLKAEVYERASGAMTGRGGSAGGPDAPDMPDKPMDAESILAEDRKAQDAGKAHAETMPEGESEDAMMGNEE